MGPITQDHLLTLSKEKKSMRSKGSLIIGALEGLELFNTLSNGWDTQKWTTPGSQLTKSTLHSSLTPITDNIPSKIKRVRPSQERASTSSPVLYHVS